MTDAGATSRPVRHVGHAGRTSNQFDESGGTFFDINLNTLYSYIYIKSDTWGTLNWGHLSPASDNPAVLADISGTVIESNAVFFEGASFFLRPKGGGSGGYGGLSGLHLGRLPALPGPWARDRHGLLRRCACRRFATTHRLGAASGSRPLGARKTSRPPVGSAFRRPDVNFWDIAVFYTADWNSIKLSAACCLHLAGDWQRHRPEVDLVPSRR